ncbi:MAG: hypothetical protein COT91_03480 [Candidatus Doudnabacteria bacterium CG10_big_fil_rev_8_21_14_0_10_41_10]|uniref:ABC transporter permease n=1 Tax=Candidatus Doudnabacteria bacterium CG10_big_fil_rev_8_21_14_0_10_41_10 TaxID=1974551 RepID=A0A2H0VDA6_9BACT|nr:MAG: hypothetical protein COT91_03480 [Candidatus Doudnabacteria bacterium CG10_big_fil_rev_8_21_14_0_10_41_10]
MKDDIKAIFWQTIKNRKKFIIVYAIIGVTLLWMYLAMFPAIAEKSDDFNKLLESYPESFTAILGVEEINFSTVENFIALEHMSIMWPIMVVLLLLGLAGPAIAGEIEKGTIELILSRPVSRVAVFAGRYLAATVALVVFILFSIFMVFPLAALHGIEISAMNHFKVSFMGLFFGLSVLSLGMLFSVIFSEKSKVYFTTGGIVGLMYIFSVASNLSENVAALKYFSFFYYFDGVQVMTKSQLNGLSVLVFLFFILLSSAFAAYHFNKRDIAV